MSISGLTHAASAPALLCFAFRVATHAQGWLPAGWLAFTGRESNPLDHCERFQIMRSSSSPVLLTLLKLIWYAVAGLFRSRAALQTEVLALRHQLNVLRRRAPKRVAVSNIDRLVFAGLYHLAPEVLDAVKILKPETIIRWHRAGFRAWGRWKSSPRGGRPRAPDEVRQLICEMSLANP